MAARVARFGWHLQFQFDASEFTTHAARLARLPCDIVIDHIGRFAAPIDLNDANVRALVSLRRGAGAMPSLYRLDSGVARVAELADARDLKSRIAQAVCGFDSRFTF